MKDKNGLKLEIGDCVSLPSYYPHGTVENERGDIRIPGYGIEHSAAEGSTKCNHKQPIRTL